MSRVCMITGKSHQVGNKVSHAHKKAKRRFGINLHAKRFWLADQKTFIKLRVSTKGLRVIDKYGIEAVLASLSDYAFDIQR